MENVPISGQALALPLLLQVQEEETFGWHFSPYQVKPNKAKKNMRKMQLFTEQSYPTSAARSVHHQWGESVLCHSKQGSTASNPVLQSITVSSEHSQPKQHL